MNTGVAPASALSCVLGAEDQVGPGRRRVLAVPVIRGGSHGIRQDRQRDEPNPLVWAGQRVEVEGEGGAGGGHLGGDVDELAVAQGAHLVQLQRVQQLAVTGRAGHLRPSHDVGEVAVLVGRVGEPFAGALTLAHVNWQGPVPRCVALLAALSRAGVAQAETVPDLVAQWIPCNRYCPDSANLNTSISYSVYQSHPQESGTEDRHSSGLPLPSLKVNCHNRNHFTRRNNLCILGIGFNSL